MSNLQQSRQNAAGASRKGHPERNIVSFFFSRFCRKTVWNVCVGEDQLDAFFTRQTVAADISVMEQWGTHARSHVTGGVRAHAADASRSDICNARVQAYRNGFLQRVKEHTSQPARERGDTNRLGQTKKCLAGPFVCMGINLFQCPYISSLSRGIRTGRVSLWTRPLQMHFSVIDARFS